MAIPPKPTIAPLPTAPDVADQGTFNDRANLFVPALPTFGSQLDDVAVWTGDRATDSETAQTAAETAQGLAEGAQAGSETAQGLAEGARDTALGHRNAAEGFKDQAETAASAAGAAAGLPSLAGNAGNVLKVAAGESGVEWTTGLEFDEFTISRTWTKAPGVQWIMVELVAGGKGGEAFSATSSDNRSSEGGMAVHRLFPAASVPASVTVTVGAGGAGGVASGGTGSAVGSEGNASSFGTLISTPASKFAMGVAYGSGSASSPDGRGDTLAGGAGSSSFEAPKISLAHGNGGAPSVGTGAQTAGDGQRPGGAGGCAVSTNNGTATAGDGGDGIVRVWQW